MDRRPGFLQRFEQMRDRADRLISTAERIFGPDRRESVRKEPAPDEPAPAEPLPTEPAPREPGAADPA